MAAIITAAASVSSAQMLVTKGLVDYCNASCYEMLLTAQILADFAVQS